jgi:hypothetical protein
MIALGDQYTFNALAIGHLEEEFLRAVTCGFMFTKVRAPDGKRIGQSSAQGLLEIGHGLEAIDLIPIDPAQDLVGPVRRLTGGGQPLSQRCTVQIFDIFFYDEGPLQTIILFAFFKVVRYWAVNPVLFFGPPNPPVKT